MKIIQLILASLLLFSSCVQLEIEAHTQTVGVHYSGLPKVDEILYKAYLGVIPEVIVDEFLAGETDWLGGPSRRDLYQEVVDAGHKISSMDPMDDFDFILINCRDYKETSGEPNFPLNDSSFRIALSYIYGMDRKQADVYNYYQVDWQYAIGNPVPPAQEPWYDETVQMPDTNWTRVWSILQAAGYHIDPTENWLYHNNTKLRNMTAIYSTGLYWPWGPGGGFVDAFNEFIESYLGANGPTMEILPTDFMSLVYQLLRYHDFDFVCIGLMNRGRFVDWLYDLLHSSNDAPEKWNFVGIHDPEFDQWTETILTSLNTTEVIEAASKLQQKFVYELMPWIPTGSGRCFCVMARDERGELMNVVSMPNYGPMNDWSYMSIHWKGEAGVAWPGGTVTVALDDEPHSLNPYTEDTSYGWQILDRAVTGLTMLDPNTLVEIPFVATDWEVSYWVSIPELGIVNGSMCTFYLRQDVMWHDGTSVTAYDCVSNMKIMRKYKPETYRSTWENLVYEEADGPYKFSVYFDQTSLHYPYYVAKAALLAPKHILDLVEAEVEEEILPKFEDWNPAFNTYEDLTGEASPAEYPFMKQVVGCGPFVFDYYDRSLATGRVVRYEGFFVSAPVIGSVVGEWRTDPGAPYLYRVLVQNLGACEDSEEGELVPATVYIKVYEDGVLAHEETGITLNPWEWTYLGQYSTDSLAGGEHKITVEVYEGGNLIHTYEHKLVATIREDVTTYNGDVLDFKVDILDVAWAAKAFGSYPSHLRWDPPADTNDDFKVNIMDIEGIAKKFGWAAPT